MTFLDGASEHGRDARGAHVLYGVFAALYTLFVGLSCAVEGLLVREDKRHATCRIRQHTAADAATTQCRMREVAARHSRNAAAVAAAEDNVQSH